MPKPPARILFALCLLAAHAYAPAQAAPHPYLLPNNTIQIITAAPLAGPIQALDTLYATAHPGATFTLRAGDNYSAMAALTFDRSAVAPLGCEYTRIGLGDNLKIAAEPLAIRIAHATLAPGPGVPALGVIVNPANPLARLSLAQLTRIFTVGGPAGDIATWSQAGVTDSLGPREIHPAGPLASDYLPSDDPQAGEFLANTIFSGLLMNHAYAALPHYADVVARVREDPAAIAITALNLPLEGVKVLPLQRTESSPAVPPTAHEITAGRYPLDRFVYLYLRLGKGQPLDPFAVAYTRAALSPEGQQALASEPTGYLTLSAAELAIERARLDR